MGWQPHPYSLVLIVSAAMSVGVARAVWRRPAAGARTCAVLMLALAWWSVFYAAELLSTSHAAQIRWVKIEYIGILSAPLAWLVFALRFTGRDADINLTAHEPEFSAYQWVSLNDLPGLIVPFKRDTYRAVIAEFAHLA